MFVEYSAAPASCAVPFQPFNRANSTGTGGVSEGGLAWLTGRFGRNLSKAAGTEEKAVQCKLPKYTTGFRDAGAGGTPRKGAALSCYLWERAALPRPARARPGVASALWGNTSILNILVWGDIVLC